jgi:hypothetical protein
MLRAVHIGVICAGAAPNADHLASQIIGDLATDRSAQVLGRTPLAGSLNNE